MLRPMPGAQVYVEKTQISDLSEAKGEVGLPALSAGTFFSFPCLTFELSPASPQGRGGCLRLRGPGAKTSPLLFPAQQWWLRPVS